MTAITNKMTKAQLVAMVEQLLGEKAALQHENQEMKKKLETKNNPSWLATRARSTQIPGWISSSAWRKP